MCAFGQVRDRDFIKCLFDFRRTNVVVIALTAFVGLALVAFFVLMFLDQMSGQRNSDRDSLMPLADEISRPANPVSKRLGKLL